MNKNSKWMKKFKLGGIKFDKSLDDYRQIKNMRKKKP